MKTWKRFLAETRVRESDDSMMGDMPQDGGEDSLSKLPKYGDNRLPPEVEKAKETALQRFKREVGEVNQAVVSIIDDLLTAVTGSSTSPF